VSPDKEVRNSLFEIMGAAWRVCLNTGFFCLDIELFCLNIGLFSLNIGLFGLNIGLFCVDVEICPRIKELL